MHCSTGDGCSVTGQFRCQQEHWAFDKVRKPEALIFCHQNFGVGNLSEEITVSCQVYGPGAAIAHPVCFNIANEFGDRGVAKQMVDLYGWDTFKQRSFDRIGECPSAAFITGAEFAHVKSIVETSSDRRLRKTFLQPSFCDRVNRLYSKLITCLPDFASEECNWRRGGPTWGLLPNTPVPFS